MAVVNRITRAQLQAIKGLDQRGVLAFESLFAAVAADALQPGDIVYSAVPSSTVTITIASPAVITWTAHGRATGDAVSFSTTGALPTGLTAGTVYYVLAVTTNTFTISATPGGAAINTSGTQSGTQKATALLRDGAIPANGAAVSRTLYPDLFAKVSTSYGVGDGSTTFNVPNVSAVGSCPAFIVY